ncbi:hypothetical protein [Ruminococcus albus]|uniref:Uncharacterized protein n=1 Tax=Ruminococcus albus TaxID=1264 RepID=A0A1I1KU72_RUMAL|nr:hypothetical protein [Ruminococcus albus]SFC64377.1 hypothetical protein SAMN02910406_02086 [Ruminococcus albus]
MDISLVRSSALHDARFIGLYTDYDNARVILTLFDKTNEPVEICVENVLSLSMTRNEPWGKGSYVASSDIVSKDDCDLLTIELNSGDVIAISFND